MKVEPSEFHAFGRVYRNASVPFRLDSLGHARDPGALGSLRCAEALKPRKEPTKIPKD